MTQPPPPTHETEVELSDEEFIAITAKAKAIGYDLETYLRVRALTAGSLPEPSAFFDITRRLSRFARDYKACLMAVAQRRPDAQKRADVLAVAFARLLQEWDDLYGPRP